jgi:hypothetical protein
MVPFLPISAGMLGKYGHASVTSARTMLADVSEDSPLQM